MGPMQTTACIVEALAGMGDEPEGVAGEHFWRVVERYRATLVHQAFLVLGNQTDAEDAAQETFCKAFSELHTLRDSSKMGAWLRAINRRNALALCRKRAQSKEERLATGQLNTVAAPTGGGGTTFHPVSRNAKLLRAIEELPETFRDVLILRYWEKLPNEQIAARLGVPEGTVRSRLARADAMLAQKLKSVLRQEEHPK